MSSFAHVDTGTAETNNKIARAEMLVTVSFC